MSQRTNPIKPNWLELPARVTAKLLHKLGPVEILVSAQKVCSAWYKICKDPAMWRVIHMRNSGDSCVDMGKLFKQAVNRSQGQLVDVAIEYFGNNDLMDFVADRSSQLRRIQVLSCYYSIDEDSWSEFFEKVPLLEELSLILTYISSEALEDATRYCPMLKSFKYCNEVYMPDSEKVDSVKVYTRFLGRSNIVDNVVDNIIAIAGGMTQLRHLKLGWYTITNERLKAILDGCPRLESLDLRCCVSFNLDGRLKERCMKQIKDLKLPEDSIEDYTEGSVETLDGYDENYLSFLQYF